MTDSAKARKAALAWIAAHAPRLRRIGPWRITAGGAIRTGGGDTPLACPLSAPGTHLSPLFSPSALARRHRLPLDAVEKIVFAADDFAADPTVREALVASLRPATAR